MASDDAWRAGLACSVSELTAEEANERSAELIIEGGARRCPSPISACDEFPFWGLSARVF